jgi:hypothetical protein
MPLTPLRPNPAFILHIYRLLRDCPNWRQADHILRPSRNKDHEVQELKAELQDAQRKLANLEGMAANPLNWGWDGPAGN